MDINACISHLGLNRNNYKLNQSVPPHVIVQWSGPDDQPTESELQSAWSEIEKLQYKDQRAVEYPRLEEQLDYIYHYGVDAWKTNVIDPIKNKYPKPE